MKKVSVLMFVLAFTLTGIQAQSNTTVIDKKVNRITITSTKVDESGKPVTETWIAEGEQPETILKEMAINPEIMQKVEASQLNTTENEETIFLFRNAGDHTVIEGKLGELNEVTPMPEEEGMKKVIIIRDNGNGEKEYQKISTWTGERAAYSFHHSPEKKANCAALGVYVLSDTDEFGCRINSLIQNGGAMDAGLREGDVIRRIDEFEVDDFGTLHLALAHFMPGDVVTVRFEREGKMEKAKVNLKAWAELPGHEWRQRSDCGKPATATPEPEEIPTEKDPGQINGLEQLHLADVRVYPNPTEGNFALSFNTAPGELTVAITDVNGKVIYHEVNENSTGYYNREIDLRDVPTGNYVLSVKQGEKLFTQQVAKQ